MYIKKLIIVSTFIISFTSKAQKLEKGTWLVGGNLTFLNISQKVPVGSFGGGYGGQFGGYGSGYSSSPSPTTSVSTNIFVGSLSLSKMATKYFAIGAKASYINTGGVDGSILGPTTRFYVNYDKPSTFFLTGDYGWNTNGGGTAYDFGLGLSNLLNDYISIDIVGTYGNSFTTNGTSQRSESGVDIFALQVGLQILLPKRKR